MIVAVEVPAPYATVSACAGVAALSGVPTMGAAITTHCAPDGVTVVHEVQSRPPSVARNTLPLANSRTRKGSAQLTTQYPPSANSTLRQTCSPVYLAVPLSCRPTYITAGSSAFWARKFVQSVAGPALRCSNSPAPVGFKLTNTPPSLP